MSSPQAAAARAVVRYADPSSWAVVAAVRAAAENQAERLTRAARQTALIHVAPMGPREAAAQVQRDAMTGFASPVRFPAAAPSAPAGLACLALGLRGPSLCLTMPAARGTDIALCMAEAWLERGVAELCALVLTAPDPSSPPRAACVLLALADGLAPTPRPEVGRTLSELLARP